MGKMKLIFDVGNSFSKMAIFDDDELLNTIAHPSHEITFVQEVLNIHNPYMAFICAVRDVPEELIALLKNKLEVAYFHHGMKLPFDNQYKSKETLGLDRMAGVAGAHFLFPNEHVLVIDAGTCITFDILTAEGIYLGGSISPGINMRFKALNKFTGRLPLVEDRRMISLTGDTTESSIHSGVYNGILGEVERQIRLYKEKFGKLRVVITGGDHDFFESNLKLEIFAQPNLVLYGLNKILDYNA